MDITSILVKVVAKKAACVVADALVPGSSCIVKGVFRISSFGGQDRMAEVVGKLGIENSLNLAGAIGEAEDSVVDTIMGWFLE